MLAAAVEEMNRYGESLQEVLEYLNIIPENKASESYMMKFVYGDYVKVLEKNYKGFSPNTFEYVIYIEDELNDLFTNNKKLYESLERNFCENDDSDGSYIQYDPGKLVSFDSATNVFTFAIEREGVEAKLLVERVTNNLNLDLKNFGMMF
jgi:hypothetical protein